MGWERNRTLVFIGVGGGAWVGVIGVLFSVTNTVLLPRFQELERQDLLQKSDLAGQFLHDTVERMKPQIQDWAIWDETYAFLEGENPEYVAAQLPLLTILRLDVNLVAYVDMYRQVPFAQMVDLDQQAYMATPSGLLTHISESEGLAAAITNRSFATDYVIVDGRLLMLVAYPVLPTSGMGEPMGMMVLGRYVTSTMVDQWQTDSHLELALTLPTPNSTSRWSDQDYVKTQNGWLVHVDIIDTKAINSSILIENEPNRPVAWLTVRMPRTIYRTGLQVSRYLVFSLAAIMTGGLFLLGWMWWALIKREAAAKQILAEKMQVIQHQYEQLTVVEQTLKQQMSQTETKNRELEETKVAMLNLLEDEKEAELRLTEEKAGVEQKVKERTKALEESQQKLADSALRLQQEQARLTASIHSLSMGFLITNLQGQVIMVNHRVNEILSRDESHWTVGKLYQVLPEIDLVARWQESISQGTEVDIEEVAYGGQFLRLLFTPIKITEESGQVIGAVVLIEDVTETRQLQKTRDEFFAVAAHELRTPLTAIRGNTSMIKQYFWDELKNDELKQMVSDIHEASIRLIGIVNDFLDASRLELKKMQLNLEVFDVVSLIKDAIRDLEAASLEKKLALQLDYQDEGVYFIRADKARTMQVIVNLLGNALKYTDTGSVRVWVEGDEGEVRVKVTDSGNGIPSDQQQYLFQKFRQVGGQGYTRSAPQSTGMGLYIVRLLMEAMGGRVFLEWSEAGKGSTFTTGFERAEKQ